MTRYYSMGTGGNDAIAGLYQSVHQHAIALGVDNFHRLTGHLGGGITWRDHHHDPGGARRSSLQRAKGVGDGMLRSIRRDDRSQPRYSSCVTLRTSATLVCPLRTLIHASSLNVRIPFSTAVALI